jgi:hypothetical protein
MGFSLEFEPPVNGRSHKTTVFVRDDARKVVTTDTVNMVSMQDRQKFYRRLSRLLGESEDAVTQKAEEGWSAAVNQHIAQRANQDANAQTACGQVDVEILDTCPDAIRRPLCLAAGHAYAVTWLHVQRAVTQTVNPKTGEVQTFDPPRMLSEVVLAVVRDDGQLFAEMPPQLPSARPLSDLGLDVKLPFQPPPDRCWSGAGVKHYLAGERPDAVSVFNRILHVVNHFMDFNRSLAPQHAMCELVACFTLATYLLDAFIVVGYLWPNGDKGSGKTNFLVVVCEVAYLRQVILAGGSFASLRDLADYAATLAFDDAEGVMDIKRYDADKRALLLAGNRRGATVTVKELAADKTWVTRHISTFCPRLFSAIRMPDDVLASRSITVPLVRSGDPAKAKAQPLDHATWPHDRQRLVDDLWALGLIFLPRLRKHDLEAARKARLSGRDLEPWRALLAIAHWLSEDHEYTGLFERMEELSMKYQEEHSDLEANDAVRVLVKALFEMIGAGENCDFAPKLLASKMHAIAVEEGLADETAAED